MLKAGLSQEGVLLGRRAVVGGGGEGFPEAVRGAGLSRPEQIHFLTWI